MAKQTGKKAITHTYRINDRYEEKRKDVKREIINKDIVRVTMT